MSPADPSPESRPDKERLLPELRVLQGGADRTRGRIRATREGDRFPTRAAIVVLVGALCAIGLVMVLSASAYTSLVDYGSVWTIFERQVLWMALGGIAMFAAAKVRYDH